MHPLLIACLAGVGFAAAHYTCGRRRRRRGSAAAAGGVFAAGAIVGPAVAVVWGWLPAVLWIVLGSVFVGAVQDLGASLLSRRGGGRTLGEVAGAAINRRARVAFLGAALVCLTLALSVFALVAAAVFKAYPAAIFPCVVLAAAAAGTGIVRRRLGGSLALPCLGLAAVYAATFWGDAGPLHEFNAALAAWPTWAWAAALLACALAAGSLPAAWYARPRDSINALQLVAAMALVVAGLVVASVWGGAPPVEGASRATLEMVAPAWDFSPPGAPPIWPFLFVTIAGGACSGFHRLVSSGTSSKQLASEPDARFVGYGAMLTEGFLAVLVVLACGAGLGLGATRGWQDADWPTGTAAENANEIIFSWDYVTRSNQAAKIHLRKEPLNFFLLRDDGSGPKLVGHQQNIEQFTPTKPEAAAPTLTDNEWASLVSGTSDTAKVFELGEEKSLHQMVGFHRPDVPIGMLDGIWVAGDGYSIALTGPPAFAHQYQSWQSADGLSAAVGAFVTGAGNLVAAVGLPRLWATALMAVLVASFAGTTLDTAVRLQRYVVQELLGAVAPAWFGPRPDVRGDEGSCGPTGRSRASETGPRPVGPQLPSTRSAWLATFIAVVTGGLLAAIPASGEWTLANVGSGGLILWPLFGASNGLLAGLAFAVILFHLRRRRIVTWFLLPPMLFMLVMPAWAMTGELPAWWRGGRYVLAGVGFLCLALETWIVIEAALLYGRVKGVAEGTLERRGFEVLPT